MRTRTRIALSLVLGALAGLGAKEPPAPKEAPAEKTAHVQSIEDELRQKLALKVEIRVRGKDKGQIVLTFESNDDFERLLEVLR